MLFASHVIILTFSPILISGLPFGQSIKNLLDSWLGINDSQLMGELSNMSPCVPNGKQNGSPTSTAWRSQHTDGPTVVQVSGSAASSSSYYSSGGSQTGSGNSAGCGDLAGMGAMDSVDGSMNSTGLSGLGGDDSGLDADLMGDLSDADLMGESSDAALMGDSSDADPMRDSSDADLMGDSRPGGTSRGTTDEGSKLNQTSLGNGTHLGSSSRLAGSGDRSTGLDPSQDTTRIGSSGGKANMTEPGGSTKGLGSDTSGSGTSGEPTKLSDGAVFDPASEQDENCEDDK